MKNIIKMFNEVDKESQYAPYDEDKEIVYEKIVEYENTVENKNINTLYKLFKDIMHYCCPISNGRYWVSNNAINCVYSRFKTQDVAKVFRTLCLDHFADHYDHEDLWFSMFNELYNKQNTIENKFKSTMALFSLFNFSFDEADEHCYDREDFEEMANEFIKNMDKYYYSIKK